MKRIYYLMTLLISITSSAQQKQPADFGYKHIVFKYKTDSVHILIKSKKGEEQIQKPLFFFCQGSLPKPLIKYNDKAVYGVFPFDPDSLSQKFHLVIVGKPYIPVVAHTATLTKGLDYVDESGKFPKSYSDRNLLTYYVNRNLAVINMLQQQTWVSKKQLIVAGHSEGSTVAAKMAEQSRLISHLIYSGGNPLGRIMSIIQQSRFNETDSTRNGEQEFLYWQEVVKNKNDMDDSQGDTHKATYQFSQPSIDYIAKLTIPVLVSYGTKDWSAPFTDFMRVDFIRKGKKNVSFQPYIGTEHNFFPVTADNRPNYDVFNWDRVAGDWLRWILMH